MDHNILLSKIVANPTDTTWSQAYSTLNLYITLSIRADLEGASIASEGKEILERLQREFFANEEKSLKNVKEAVENTVDEIKDNIDYSIILATITNDILYIVIASEGSVVIKRADEIGIIGEGESGKINTFSGKLLNNDIVILETRDFANKISLEKLSLLLDHLEVVEISENLAPIIHEGSNGSEAAIILQYKKGETFQALSESEDEEEPEIEMKPPLKIPFKNPLSYVSLKKPSFAVPLKLSSLGGNKKFLILGGILILVFVLIGSLYFESKRQEKIKEGKALEQVLTPIEKQLKEANDLINLNKSLALDEFENLKQKLEGQRTKFKPESASRKKIDELIGQIEGKIGELGQGAVSSQKLLLDGKQEEIKNADLVGKKGNVFYVVNKNEGTVSLLKSDGKIDKTVKTGLKNITLSASDSNNIYLLAESTLNKLPKAGGKTSSIATSVSGNSMDTFLDNIYVLNNQSVDKYQAPDFSKKPYFAESVKFDSSPVSLSIDSSIWIIQNNGKVRKFTRGKEENFEVKGLPKTIGKNAQISTGKDFDNIYVLDKENKRLVSISKSGDFKNQYSIRDITSASDIAIDETEKKAYITANGNLYSVDL